MLLNDALRYRRGQRKAVFKCMDYGTYRVSCRRDFRYFLTPLSYHLPYLAA